MELSKEEVKLLVRLINKMTRYETLEQFSRSGDDEEDAANKLIQLFVKLYRETENV